MTIYLQLDDALFDRVFDDEAGSVDGFELPKSVRAVYGLHLSGGVPPPGVRNRSERKRKRERRLAGSTKGRHQDNQNSSTTKSNDDNSYTATSTATSKDLAESNLDLVARPPPPAHRDTHGSIRKMWFATVRLSATPPALRLMRSTFTAGSVWKA